MCEMLTRSFASSWRQLAAAAIVSLAACSGAEPPPVAQTAAANPARAEPEELKACALVTAAEMTSILGGAVTATARDGEFNGQTSCTYSPVSGISPYAELKLEWGMGEAAMMAGGLMARIEPGLTNSYAGLGDQAIVAGPAIMIRRGEDLVTIVLSGVEQPAAAARKIYETAAARM